MDKLIGYCGLDCRKCDAYIATQTNNEQLRQKTAELWAKLNNAPITAEMINCDGCRAGERKTVFCESMCEIKKCAESKKLEICADCENKMSCDILNTIVNTNDEVKQNKKWMRLPIDTRDEFQFMPEEEIYEKV